VDKVIFERSNNMEKKFYNIGNATNL
jgi:hypothetical protein